MKKTITALLTVIIGFTSWADIPDGYYSNAIGKRDEALMTALEGIIYTHSQLSYNFLWDCYPYTDAGSDGYYIDMYSTCKYNHDSYHVGSASYVGQGLNREHSFPKSWFGGEVAPMYTDLMMIIPTDGYVNQRRNNNPYGVCAGGVTYVNEELGVSMRGKLGTSTYNGYTATVFEPDDEYKGDFARIYFYMVTCYKSAVSTWPGCGQLDYSSNGYKAFSDWSIQMLMEWHRADPVSAKEIARNEAVYSSKVGNKDFGQGNRNPFVDHPELAEYIWGTKQHTPWTGQDTPSPLDKLVPVMYAVDTTAVTGTSFRADWTPSGDVSSYNLKVNRIADVGEDIVNLVISEGFSKVEATSDGGNDINSSLDNYTDNPGWTGYKVYVAANHGLKIGTANAVGYLVSPELELESTISVVFNAKNWIGSAGSDGSSVIVSCGDVSETITLTDEPADYTVVLTGCTEKNVKLSMTANKKRFYVYHVDVYNGDLIQNPPTLRAIVEEGDSTWRNVSGITDTCYTVQALTSGIYEYYVKAIYTDGTESVWSNIQHVTLVGDGSDTLIGDVNCDDYVSIADVTALIDYLLTGNAASIDLDAADVNRDGGVSIADVTALIDVLLQSNKP
ncbi:MAG: endonuclease [Muribaculaceae bacterium]|nr:endonuclease [Muribaculaceae bacterium]